MDKSSIKRFLHLIQSTKKKITEHDLIHKKSDPPAKPAVLHILYGRSPTILASKVFYFTTDAVNPL